MVDGGTCTGSTFAGTAQIVLRRDGQTVQLGTFTSVAEAVAAARSLWKVEPRT